MRVFVVEDSPSLRERLNRTLSSIQGVEVVGHAATATDAVERIARCNPDTVILDIRLSEGNGLQVLEAVRLADAEHHQMINHHPMTKHRTMIILTNYPYPQYRKRFLEAGADYFFDKSVEFEQVVETLKHLSHQHPGASQHSPVASVLSEEPSHHLSASVQ